MRSSPGHQGSASGETSLAWLLLSICSVPCEVDMTTPYFMPDEAVITALLTAGKRGVKVTDSMPERNDSRLVHFTCRNNYAINLVA